MSTFTFGSENMKLTIIDLWNFYYNICSPNVSLILNNPNLTYIGISNYSKCIVLVNSIFYMGGDIKLSDEDTLSDVGGNAWVWNCQNLKRNG